MWAHAAEREEEESEGGKRGIGMGRGRRRGNHKGGGERNERGGVGNERGDKVSSASAVAEICRFHFHFRRGERQQQEQSGKGQHMRVRRKTRSEAKGGLTSSKWNGKGGESVYLAVPALLPCSPVAFLRRLLWDNHAVGLVRRPWYRARARSFGSRCCQVGAAALEFIFCRSRNAVMVEKSNSSKKAAKSQSAGHATDWSERAHAGDKRPSGGHALAANGA